MAGDDTIILDAVQVRHLSAHVGSKPTDRLCLDGYRSVYIAFQHLLEGVRHCRSQRIVKGAGASEIGLGHPADPRPYPEITDTGFTQRPIEVGKHEVEEFLCRVVAIDAAGSQPTHHEEHMEHETFETAIEGIGNGIAPKEGRSAGLGHDGIVKDMGALAET